MSSSSPRDMPTSADYARSAADKAERDAKDALRRIARIERILLRALEKDEAAGSSAELTALREEMRERSAVRKAPSFGDVMRELYSPETVAAVVTPWPWHIVKFPEDG